MSSFEAVCKNRKTGEILSVICFDDHFGKNQYGYKINNNNNIKIYNENEFNKYYELMRRGIKNDTYKS